MLPDNALDRLSSYPQFSWAAAVIVLIGFAVLVYRGVVTGTASRDPPTSSPGGPVNVYFDGPLLEALKTLKEIAESLLPLRALPAQLKEQHDEAGERMRVDRGKIHDRIDEEVREISTDQRRQDERINDLGERIARLEGGRKR